MYIKEMKIERRGSGEKTSAYVYILPDFISNGRKLPHPCPHASPCLVRLCTSQIVCRCVTRTNTFAICSWPKSQRYL
jgi:hypothetical protein